MSELSNASYVNIMVESLKKKQGLVNTLYEKTVSQSECIKGKEYDDIDWAQFEIYMNEKDSAIERINALDEGFEATYERVKETLNKERELYSEEIKTMQEIIKWFTDYSAKIMVLEERNRADIERVMTKAKAEIKGAKKSMKVTNKYMTQMYGRGVSDNSMYMDKKK